MTLNLILTKITLLLMDQMVVGKVVLSMQSNSVSQGKLQDCLEKELESFR